MIRDPIAPKWRVILGTLSIVLLIGLYTYLSYRQKQINPTDKTIPDWGQLFHGFMKTVTPQAGGEIWLLEDSMATLGRLLGGMGVGLAVAILLGFLMGTWAPVEAFLLAPMNLMAKLNPMAMLGVFFVLVGTNTEMFIAIVAFGIVPVLAQTIYLSAKSDVPVELIHKAYTLGASHAEVAIRVVAHAVLPKVIDAIRLLIGPALVYLLAAELMVGEVGFGCRIRLQFRKAEMDVVYPYIAILALFGYGADRFLSFLILRLCPWYGDAAASRGAAQGGFMSAFAGLFRAKA